MERMLHAGFLIAFFFQIFVDILCTFLKIQRICLEFPENPKFNFAPSPGKISNLYLPSGGVGLRVDSAVYPGYTIPPYYDSMIAKIIVHGENRFEALMKMQRALYEFEIDGVVTNADFQLDLISDRSVIAGDYDTSFLMETFLPEYQNREG